MSKRIKFIISFMLIFAIFVGCFCMPAASYETNVETSSADMILVNLDTDTVAFSQKPDNMWYAGYLSELMTFLIAYEQLPDSDTIEYKVEKTFISALPHSDGCLDRFVGKTLCATDLMAIMLLTSGSDAAYALADLCTSGDRAAFVAQMNERAQQLGCTNTSYASPGYDETTDHVTTCRDLLTVYKKVRENSFYNTLMKNNAYVPKGYDNEMENYLITSEASIMNQSSPYYFRYVNGAKYSYTAPTYESIALTTTYRGKTYFFAALLGLNGSEKNVYADAKALTTWAYLNLSDQKVIAAEDSVSKVKVDAGWSTYDVELHSNSSSVKTLPNEYDESKLSYAFDIPETVKTPVMKGQAVGKTTLSYDGEVVDSISLIVESDEGLGMLSDMGRLTSYIYSQLTPNEPETQAPTEAPPETAAAEATAAEEAPAATETEG